MFFSRKRKKDCGLLPHKRTNMYGVGPSMQFTPWPIITFDIKKYWSISKGENINIAVLDTGCDFNHNDIKSSIYNGWNIIENNSNFMDYNGHGTHVAGTISASDNTLGVVGVAPKSKIIPVKVLGDDGQGSNMDVAKGIVWATDNQADIITMSLGSIHGSRPIEDAINYAKTKGVLIVCAAGNSGNDHDIMYPAKYPQTISIGAIDRNLMLCDFSCTGDSLDFVAPGEDIPSCVPGNQYALMSGTSMANPYAVGCLAITLSALKNSGKTTQYSKEDIVKLLCKNSSHIKDKAGDRRYEGCGIVHPVT